MAKNSTRNIQNKSIETITHDAKRKNIPTAEFEPVMRKDEKTPIRAVYERRNKDLDPQLVWRGKDVQDWSDLVVHAPPLYIQEKVHPKYLIDDLKRLSEKQNKDKADVEQVNLFADFNGLPSVEAKTEFYQHDSNWSNRMILGDSLQVMASLAEREGLRGQVQCIYFDPPYGIKFNSNFQWSTTSRDVKDGNVNHITREPEQVKAFRDTWKDGIHSYLTYLRDRLTVARELLTESGSIFVQIGDENVHRVRALMDEIFGDENFVSQITFVTTSPFTTDHLGGSADYLLWYSKKKVNLKLRHLWRIRSERTGDGTYSWIELENGCLSRLTMSDLRGEIPAPKGVCFRAAAIVSSGITATGSELIEFQGKKYAPSPRNHWKTSTKGMKTLILGNRVLSLGNILAYKRKETDFPVMPYDNVWNNTIIGSFSSKVYVVQTAAKVIERCLLMTTDPGDLVLDPTCGSGSTAYVAEQWGRRWITIDTSRVALALARARIMGARYPFYLLLM